MFDLHDFQIASIQKARELERLPIANRRDAFHALIADTRSGMHPEWIAYGMFKRMYAVAFPYSIFQNEK